jgi:hypothetical protein
LIKKLKKAVKQLFQINPRRAADRDRSFRKARFEFGDLLGPLIRSIDVDKVIRSFDRYKARIGET